MRVARNGFRPVVGKFTFIEGDEKTVFEFARPSREALNQLDVETVPMRELTYKILSESGDIASLEEKRQDAIKAEDFEQAKKLEEKTRELFLELAQSEITPELLLPFDNFCAAHTLSVSPLEAPDENGDLVEVKWSDFTSDEQLATIQCLGMQAVRKYADAIKSSTELGAPAKEASGRTSSSSSSPTANATSA